MCNKKNNMSSKAQLIQDAKFLLENTAKIAHEIDDQNLYKVVEYLTASCEEMLKNEHIVDNHENKTMEEFLAEKKINL